MKVGGGTLVRLTLSGVALVASTAAACCFLAVWSYWYHELDADCVQDQDCKCLLFGTSFAGGSFVGGDRFACQYVAYSLLASAMLAACACVYHGCSSLLCPGPRRRHRHHRPIVRSTANTGPEDDTSSCRYIIIYVLLFIEGTLHPHVLSYKICTYNISKQKRVVAFLLFG